MNWKSLNTTQDIQEAKVASHHQPVVIFKHSTRCSISGMALNRMERSWNEAEMEGVDAYFLDLIQHSPLSQAVAQEFEVHHESPQLLLIKDGKCVYHTSHMGISYQALKDQLRAKV